MDFSFTRKPVNIKKIILAAALFLLLVHIIFTFAGFYGDDDINYARQAATIAHHELSDVPATSQFQLRWTTIYITGFFYWLFGINEFTSVLCSFVAFGACGCLLYKLFRKATDATFFIVVILFFFTHPVLLNVHRLLADPAMCFATFWLYYIYRSLSRDTKIPVIKALQFSIALWLAIITKETVILVLPLIICLFIYDIVKKRNRNFWLFAILFNLLLCSVYLLYFKITTGDGFYRYHLLLSRSYLNECSYDKLPLVNLFRRVGFELWQAMLLNGDLIVLLPAVAAILYYKRLLATGTRKLDLAAAFILLCCANFMTVSPSGYVPLCPAPRQYLFIYPFAVLVGAPLLSAFLKAPRQYVMLPVLFIAATAWIFFIPGGRNKYLYLAIAGLLLMYYIFDHFNFESIAVQVIAPGKQLTRIIWTGLILIAVSSVYIYPFFKPLYPFFAAQKTVIKKAFPDKKATATVFTADPFSAELSEFFTGFKSGNLKFLPADSIKAFNPGTLYFLLVPELNAGVKEKMDSLVSRDPSITVKAEQNNVILYTINEEALQEIKGFKK